MSKKTNHIALRPFHVKVYRYIEKYIKKNLVSPEVTEISAGVHIAKRHVYRLVDDLCELGILSKMKYQKRSIKIERTLEEFAS